VLVGLLATALGFIAALPILFRFFNNAELGGYGNTVMLVVLALVLVPLYGLVVFGWSAAGIFVLAAVALAVPYAVLVQATLEAWTPRGRGGLAGSRGGGPGSRPRTGHGVHLRPTAQRSRSGPGPG
jgi:hypothetical protein